MMLIGELPLSAILYSTYLGMDAIALSNISPLSFVLGAGNLDPLQLNGTTAV